MKTLCLTIVTLLFFVGVHAQDTTKTDSAVAKLTMFLAANVRPIAVVVENNVYGVTIVGFELDSNKNVANVRIVKSLMREFDLEVLRVFHAYQTYHQSIPLPSGEYSAGVELVINHKESKGVVTPIDKSLYKNYLFTVTVMVDRRN